MGDINSKKEFIKKLYLYYKPTLSKSKQLELLSNWISSCISSEEYEMASELEQQIPLVEDNPNCESGLKVLTIDELLSKNKDKFDVMSNKNIKPEKSFKWVNKWLEPKGFTFIHLSFSDGFEVYVLNYGIKYSKII